MENDVIKFDNAKRSKKSKENDVVIDLGTLYIDLSIAHDGSSIYFKPSYELIPEMGDALLEELKDMLKTHLLDSIDNLFDTYQSSQ